MVLLKNQTNMFVLIGWLITPQNTDLLITTVRLGTGQ
jgi:hypothetical protein